MAFGLWLVMVLGVAWWARRAGRAAAAWAALAGWLALPIYNQSILSRCPGDCGIRADLVLMLPLLLLLSVVALWGWLHAWWQRRRQR